MKEKINLLYVIYSMENGGAETLAIRLAEKLDRELFNAAVCSLSDQGPLREVMERKGVTHFTLGKKEGKDFLLPFKLRKLIKEKKFKIIHTHNQGPLLYTYLGTRLLGKIKIVHTEHINMAKEFSYSKKHLLYNNILYRSLEGFINIAHHLTDEYQRRFDLSRAKVETIHNSVDVETHQFEPGNSLREELGLNVDAPLIGNISALRSQKDHLTMIKAMKKVCEKVPDATLVIAGDGELRDKLLEAVHKYGLNSNIKFLGYRSDVDSLLAQFDIFALSSLYEGLPLCVLEAMAAGKPIVATNADGTNEVVHNEKTGLLVPIGDASSFADAILRIINDRNLASNMGDAAKMLVENKHNMAEMISNYEKYYKKLSC